ncbi:myogenesis-regulating glycosidase-like [Planococcus citri]|uniref:myogenesis-regulating glycosidase-like n=1 Tax=Planococcus citri TaxID=170843 RepID=UPI0031FA170F
MNYKKTSLLILLALLQHYTCDDDIHIEKDFIIVKGVNSSFQQLVDISSLNKSDLSVCSSQNSYYCVKWDGYAQFNVSKQDICKNFEYKTTSTDSLKVSFDLKNTHVYGGAEKRTQSWPIESSTYSAFPFVSSKVEDQAVLEPFWLFSDGSYLFIDKQTPLFISINKSANTFTIIAENKDPYFKKNQTVLKYRICKLPDMKAAYLHAVNNVIQRPHVILDVDTIRKPIWSTWAAYKTNISEIVVKNFVDEILKRDFPISHVEIDDKWETCYGSLTVNKTRFPDLKKFTADLKKRKVKTTIWVHPFINVDCQPFHDDAKKNDYFVKNDAGTTVKWWNGKGGYIDFTNPDAYEWFRKRLETLKNSTGIDAFKFDAGESDWAPDSPVFKTPDSDYPDSSLKNYIKLASSFGNMVEVRVGKGTQQYPVFVRMMDRDSTWDQSAGLLSLIPTLLQMNIIGYPFVLPDMIGGNEYDSEVPDQELFIRWLQINVFMPTLQFSIPPWNYGNKTCEIALKMLKIHNSFSNLILQSMKQFVKKGIPVNPPLWWIDPNDNVTYTIDSEFMLGEEVLVAPVLTKGAKSRDIYLPKGIWQDGNHKKEKKINGPKWLRSYKADLDTLPYFIKVNSGKPYRYGGSFDYTIAVLISGLGVILLSVVGFYVYRRFKTTESETLHRPLVNER